MRHRKATVEAYAASLLPPTAMCKLVLNLCAPKSSWRTLSELYMLYKLEHRRTVPIGPYTRPICTERDFQARWKELVSLVELDDPVATVLPKATGISWPFASWVKFILSRPGLVLNRPLLHVDGHRSGGVPTLLPGAIGPNSPSPWPILTAWPAPPRVFGC